MLPQDKHEPFFRGTCPHASSSPSVKAGHTPFWDAPERVVDAIAQTALRRAERSRA